MSEESILFANNLSYKLPIPSSVAVDRVLKRQYFQNTSYGEGQTMIATFNTGTDYIDTKNSSLVIKVKVNPGPGAGDFFCSFGRGSGLNLLKNMRIYHRTGVCYSNVQRINLYNKIEQRYNESSNWFDTVGRLMGYDQSPTLISNILPGANEVTIVIPLDKLHPFFDPAGGCLLPNVMASGLRWEADLSSLAEAFVVDASTSENPVSYEIKQVYFETMNVSLQDSAQASLNTVASKQALEYVYKDVFTSQNTSPSLTNAVNIDINKAVSYADHVCTAIQDTDSLNDILVDAYLLDYREADWWYQLGSNHYPAQVKVDDERVSYKNALLPFDKLKHTERESVVKLQDFNTRDGIYAVSLERDTALALSQSPINSSRSLRFEVQFKTAPADAITTTVFLTYLTSGRGTLTSARVDI